MTNTYPYQSSRDRLHPMITYRTGCSMAAIMLVALFLATSAQAQLVKGSPIGIEGAIGTSAPFLVGGKGTVHLPLGFFGEMELGWLPETYATLANDIAQEFGAYGQTTATLVSAALSDAFTWRASFGWRPFDPVGLEFFAGYTLTAFGGNPVAASLISEASGRNLPSRFDNQDLTLRSDLHSFHVGLGYRQRIGDFSLGFSLAYLQAFASSSSIDASSPDAQEQSLLNAASTALDAYLDDFYSTYFKLPVLSVFLGYRFL